MTAMNPADAAPNAPWWIRATAVLAASGVGRGAGLSPQLAADVAMLGTGPGEGRRVPLRVVVARTGEGPGPVPLLTGLRIADPPFVTDLLPVAVVHTGVARPELRLSPGQAAALDRLARLLTDRRQAQLAQEVLSAAPRTAAWLRVRAPEVLRGSFFSTGCAGTDEVARTLRRCQDLTAAAPASSALDATVASVLSAPAVIRAHFRASPLPWAAPTSGASDPQRPHLRGSAADGVAPAPADRDHLYPEVVDLPVVPPDRTGTESGRALRREALEILHAAHLVLAVVPAAELGGDVAPSPAIAALGGLLERVRGHRIRPPWHSSRRWPNRSGRPPWPIWGAGCAAVDGAPSERPQTGSLSSPWPCHRRAARCGCSTVRHGGPNTPCARRKRTVRPPGWQHCATTYFVR